MPDAGFPMAESGELSERRKRPQLKFGDRKRRTSADSPDSVIVYCSDQCSGNSSGAGLSGAHRSCGSRFSSTSRSAIERCSFGSDHDSLSPHLSFHLALLERCSGGNGPDQEKMGNILSSFRRSPIGSVDKAEQISHEEGEKTGGSKGEECRAPVTTNHSFSLALRECQIRRHKPEVLPFKGRKPRRQRPASLDLNRHESDVSAFSPRILAGGVVHMKKNSGTSSHSRSEALPSPDALNHPNGTVTSGCQKGCSSERVPPPVNNNRNYMVAGSYLPFNNGRVLPSKWEDAEKWIFSPISTEGVGRSLPPVHHRRPKSKSGPLGPPGFSPSSPIAPCFDSGRVGSFTGNSPFLAGVLVADRGFCDSRRGGIGGGESTRSSSANAEPYILRSASIHGCSETVLESAPSLENSQNEKLECIKGGTKSTSMLVLRKDVAIQMSPKGSTQSSPKHGLPSPLVVNTIEKLESCFPKPSARDVLVDDQVTVTRWTKKQIARGFDKRSTSTNEWKQKIDEVKPSGFVVSGTRCLSKVKREEDKISAWENLQKAKAEAAIRELEMKLEKQRSSSMDKILKKLWSAQKKAEEMRSSVTSSQTHQVPKTTQNSRSGKISSLSGCFTCHVF